MAAENVSPTVVRGISSATKSNGLLIGSSHLACVLLTGRSLRDTATPRLSVLIKAEVVEFVALVANG